MAVVLVGWRFPPGPTRSSSRSSATAAAARRRSTTSRRRWSAYRERFPVRVRVDARRQHLRGPRHAARTIARSSRVRISALLDEGVKFYAVLGNHDDPREVDYPLFNMDGERYYTFTPPEDLFARSPRASSSSPSTAPLSIRRSWLARRTARRDRRRDWKICFLHHPLYTSGRYRAERAIDPLAARADVRRARRRRRLRRSRALLPADRLAAGRAVFHLRRRRIASSRRRHGRPSSSRSFDTDYHFMLIEIDGDALHFQAITRTGETADAGVVHIPPRAPDRAGPR